MICNKCFQREVIPGELYCNVCLSGRKYSEPIRVWRNPELEVTHKATSSKRFEELVKKYRGVVEQAKKSGVIKK